MRTIFAILLLVMSPAPGRSQVPATQAAPARSHKLAEYEGIYAYRDGHTAAILVSGSGLAAIIGEGKYPLRVAGADTFINRSGESIPFVRDSARRIVGFRENGDLFARISTSIPPATRKLLVPWPHDANGLPVAYRYAAPAQLDDGIRTGAAGRETIPAGIAMQLVNGVIEGRYPEVRSILLYHKRALVLEEYFYGYDRSRPHQMRSLTKSVIALLAGAAVDRGILRPDEPALAHLGYVTYANPDPRKALVTLTDLLSHRSGFACDDRDNTSPGNEVKLYESLDWAKAFTDLPISSNPRATARYCSGGILVAGRIIERATKKMLPELAQEVLFDPLRIRRADWQWQFILDRSQRNEYAQIYLRPRDMLKLGILIEQRGNWQGQRVLSASWIDAMTARQSRVDDSDYGLGVWHRWYRTPTSAGDRRVDAIMLSGNGGQKVFIVPALELIAVFTGGAFNTESPVNEIMARVLLPALLEPDKSDGMQE